MSEQKAKPGVSRAERISSEGLQRLEKQLAAGIKINPLVLAQWVKRYGDSAVQIIKKYDTS